MVTGGKFIGDLDAPLNNEKNTYILLKNGELKRRRKPDSDCEISSKEYSILCCKAANNCR